MKMNKLNGISQGVGQDTSAQTEKSGSPTGVTQTDVENKLQKPSLFSRFKEGVSSLKQQALIGYRSSKQTVQNFMQGNYVQVTTQDILAQEEKISAKSSSESSAKTDTQEKAASKSHDENQAENSKEASQGDSKQGDEKSISERTARELTEGEQKSASIKLSIKHAWGTVKSKVQTACKSIKDFFVRSVTRIFPKLAAKWFKSKESSEEASKSSSESKSLSESGSQTNITALGGKKEEEKDKDKASTSEVGNGPVEETVEIPTKDGAPAESRKSTEDSEEVAKSTLDNAVNTENN